VDLYAGVLHQQVALVLLAVLLKALHRTGTRVTASAA
jgi:hypothetical protein